jgi:hypothetical protein
VKGAAVPPYRFGRHPITEELEMYVSEPQQAATLLQEIRDGSESTEFAERLRARFPDSHQHLFNEVFGGAPLEAEPGENERATRGRERRKLYRDGIGAALELAFHVEHGAPVTVPPERFDLIDVLWGCGQPFNQAWIGWNSVNVEGEERSVRHILLVLLSDEPAMGWEDSIVTALDPDAFPPPDARDETKGLVVMRSGNNRKPLLSRWPKVDDEQTG